MRLGIAWFCRPFIAGIIAAMASVILVGSSRAQVASPLQPGHYVPGIVNVRDMAAPPDGLFLLWYNWGISSNTFIDRDGNEFSRLNLSEVDPGYPDLDVELELDGFATVPVLAWAKSTRLLGGARYIALVAPNWVTADYKVVGELSEGNVPPGLQEGSVSGWSDLLVSPVGLSWAFGEFGETSVSDQDLAALGMPPRRRFNATTIYSFVAPTGRYSSGADDNVGLGFWTHTFQGFGYYYPFEHQATAVMAGLTYELNSSIEDVDVTPGQRLSLEWGVSQYLAPWFELSVHGAHNWQITDDSGDDVFWDPTAHDRKSSLMLGAGFWPWEGRLYAAARWGFDYGMRQRFDNTNLMINVIFITDLLTGR
jgi:hypothetical protein